MGIVMPPADKLYRTLVLFLIQGLKTKRLKGKVTKGAVRGRVGQTGPESVFGFGLWSLSLTCITITAGSHQATSQSAREKERE